MEYSTLGRTGLRLSVLGFGGMLAPVNRIGQSDHE
jgi:predicted aldo/keto reductase-like oxidoreductase